MLSGVRYVLTTMVPDVVFLAHRATNDPGELVRVLEDCDALIRTVAIKPPAGP